MSSDGVDTPVRISEKAMLVKVAVVIN